jgi:hypothetical protein
MPTSCDSCGEPSVVNFSHHVFCQFCWDYLRHELKIRLDGIRDFGQYHHSNCGPNFGMTYWTGSTTLGDFTYVSRTPQEAMNEALRVAVRKGWTLLRLDVQGGSERRLGMRSCTNIYVSEDFKKYMEYSKRNPLPYDVTRYGRLDTKGLVSYFENRHLSMRLK